MTKEKMNSPGLISVIIPVYNVEKYLNRCIDSIVCQTYKSLDIILIDDGSTDRSSNICDDYAMADTRIRVIHKKNGGLSDARNRGLQVAKGEFIHFVDGDDFIATDAIGFLLESILSNDSDIATFSYVMHYTEDADVGSLKVAKNKQLVLSTEDSLERLLYQKGVTTSAAMKLYKQKLFRPNIVFPVGKLNEDLGTVYKLFSNAEKVVINTVQKYYYYQRVGSIMQSKFSHSRMDGLSFAEEQLAYIENKYPTLIAAAQNRLFIEAVAILFKVPLVGKDYRNDYVRSVRIVKSYRLKVLLDRNSRIDYRVYALISLIHPRLLRGVRDVKEGIKK